VKPRARMEFSKQTEHCTSYFHTLEIGQLYIDRNVGVAMSSKEKWDWMVWKGGVRSQILQPTAHRYFIIATNYLGKNTYNKTATPNTAAKLPMRLWSWAARLVEDFDAEAEKPKQPRYCSHFPQQCQIPKRHGGHGQKSREYLLACKCNTLRELYTKTIELR